MRNISSPFIISSDINCEQNSFSKYLRVVQLGLEHLECLGFLEDPRRDSSYHKSCYVIENEVGKLIDYFDLKIKHLCWLIKKHDICHQQIAIFKE